MAALLFHNLCIVSILTVHSNHLGISIENLEFTDQSVCFKESRNTKFIRQKISQKICSWLLS